MWNRLKREKKYDFFFVLIVIFGRSSAYKKTRVQNQWRKTATLISCHVALNDVSMTNNVLQRKTFPRFSQSARSLLVNEAIAQVHVYLHDNALSLRLRFRETKRDYGSTRL